MNLHIFIDEIGDLRFRVDLEDKGIESITGTLLPNQLEVEMSCMHCRSWMYDPNRRAGKFYCTVGKKNKTIRDHTKLPNWCPRYKNLFTHLETK